MTLQKTKKINKFVILIAILNCFLSVSRTRAQTLPIPPNLIDLGTAQGQNLLLETKYKQDFFLLSMQFVTQVNQTYCGVASMVMVLNSLQIPAPLAPEYKPYHLFTQNNFFDNQETRKIIKPELVSRQGMNLAQLAELLKIYQVKVDKYYSSEITLEKFRKIVIESFKHSDNYIIVNYLRSAIGEKTGGHFSPLGAYNEQSDRFLILDVSRYKYPSVWVKTIDLWRAINTIDSSAGKTRGFVVISKIKN